MNIFDIFSMGVRNMWKRKLRTLLTVLGVVIGSASITLMISLGVALNMNFDALIEEFGRDARVIQVWGNTWNPQPGELMITDEVIDQINALPMVQVATPMVNSWLTFSTGRYLGSMSVTGVRPEAMPLLGIDIMEGRGLTDGDTMAVVFGSEAHMQFRNPRGQGMGGGGRGGSFVVIGGGRGSVIMESVSGMPGMPGMSGPGASAPAIELLGAPMRMSWDQNVFQIGGTGEAVSGQGASVRPHVVEVAGIMQGVDWRTTSGAFMPIDTVVEMEREQHHHWQSQGFGGMSQDFHLDNGFSDVTVLVYDANDVETVIALLYDMGIPNAWGNFEHIISQRAQTEIVQRVLAAVGAVALVVAAIGIANTMVMAIYERTKEIGVMKVIGASVRDIRRLFLLESTLIGALGGLVGLGISMLGAYLLNNAEVALFQIETWGRGEMGDLVSYIPLWLYALAFAFSCAVGLVFGFLPARRATKISALAAIRTD